MNDRTMEILVNRYVCSKCWGHLNAYVDPAHRWRVECPECGPGQGFVTFYYRERRLESSLEEAREVKALLKKLDVIESPHKGKSTKQILEELGF